MRTGRLALLLAIVMGISLLVASVSSFVLFTQVAIMLFAMLPDVVWVILWVVSLVVFIIVSAIVNW